MKVDSHPETEIGEETRRVIVSAAEKTLLMEKSGDCEVSIFITNDAEIHRLNSLYRDVDSPTDVLAFAMREGVDGELNSDILGDVVVSLPRAEQQASTYDHSLDMEMSLLVSHGVLHLLGYEHEEKDDIWVMKQKQREILRSLGFDLTGFVDRMKGSANGTERQVIGA